MNQLLTGLPPILALIGAYCLILAYEKQHRVERVLSKIVLCIAGIPFLIRKLLLLF